MFRSPYPRLLLPLGDQFRTIATLAYPNSNSLARSAYSTCAHSSCLLLGKRQHLRQPLHLHLRQSQHQYQHQHSPQRNNNIIHKHLSRSSNPAPVRSLGSFRTNPHRGISSPTDNPLLSSAPSHPPGISRVIVENQDTSNTSEPRLHGTSLQNFDFTTMQSTSAAPAASVHIPPIRRSSPGPLSADFVQQQVAKQQHSNYHSTSLKNMVSTSVNRTALHPGGVQ